MNAATRHFPLAIAIATLSALMPLRTAVATEFCVATAAEFQIALNAAATNNQDDDIQVVAGNYALTSGLFVSFTEPHALTISGGWSLTCDFRKNVATVLDGQDQVRPLQMMSDTGAISVQHMTFTGGLSTNNHGGGLNITTNSAVVDVENDVFTGNRADDYAGALTLVSASGAQVVRNNLFVGNSAAAIGAVELCQSSGEAYVSSNTIVYNTSDAAGAPGGLKLECNGHFNLGDNIIWGNTGNGAGDLGSPAGNSRYSNDIGTLQSGTFGDPVVNELSTDPLFVQCGFLCISFEPSRASPLVDVGDDTPPDGLLLLDLAGKPRIIGQHVDIGAYENDLIFANGVE